VISQLKHRGRSLGERLTGVAARLDFGLAVVMLLPVFAILPLLQPGLPRTADGFLHLLRVVEVDQIWGDGVYYSRWAPDMAFGYGYPIFNYFAPLLYYITETVHQIGFGFETSLKVVLIGCMVLGGWGMYALVKDVLGAKAGILAAACYVYAPYTLRGVFLTGAYAEFLALSLMPTVFWSFNRLVTRDSPLYLATSPLLLGAVIVSHNISGMLLFALLSLFSAWTICVWRRWHRVKHVLFALSLALALVAFFFVPALLEKSVVRLDRLTEDYFDFRGHFLTLGEVFSPSAVPDSSSFNPVWRRNLGVAQVVLASLGLVVMASGSLTRRQRMQCLFFLFVLVISILMTLPTSTPLWKYMPLLPFTEFPWRFLGIAALGSSFLAGASVQLWSRLRWRHSSMVVLAVLLVFTMVTAFVHLYQQWPPSRHEQLSAKDVVLHESRTGILGTTSASECLPIWVVEEPNDSPLVAQYLSDGSIQKLDDSSLPASARAELLRHMVVSDEYRIVTSEAFTVQFNTIYFPGWEALVDGRPVPVTPSYPQGLITFDVPAGEHRVVVRFGDTPVRTVANLVSLAALVTVVGATVFLSFRGREGENFRPQEVTESRLCFTDSGFLILVVLILLLIKAVIIDPHTTWFRKSSPPGRVLGVQHPHHINLEDEVLFLGYDIGSESVVPGGTLHVTLYWEAQRRLQEDYSAFLHLDDLRPNYISWSLSEEINPADLPTSTWTPGFYVSDSHDLLISPETPPGLYVLRAGLYRRESGQRLAVLDDQGNAVPDSVELATIRVRRTTPVNLTGVTREEPLTFGDGIRLLGYRLEENSTTPGDYFSLVLYWEALAEMSESYTVFVHLRDDSGQTWAQADGVPVNGTYPTWAWLRGETVEDEHLVLLDKTVPPGTYRLAVGIYELDTLKRLGVTGPTGEALGNEVLLHAPFEVLSR
jgi:hypothetical protein